VTSRPVGQVIEPLRSDTTDDPGVLFALRDLFSQYPTAAQIGPERLADLLRRYEAVRVHESQVEAALEALAIEGEVLA
jgi:hypothetical protein